MPTFSEQSEAQLSTCDERLQRIARAAIEIVDFRVLEGFRDEEGQTRALAKGTTKVAWPHGKHNRNPSLAMDIAPWPNLKWEDRERFVFMQGVIFACAKQFGIEVRFGYDWDRDQETIDEKGLRDYPHVEIVEA